MENDISANLCQKWLILCSKILLNVFHNRSLTVLLPWQHTGFQASPILKAFPATFVIPCWYLLLVLHNYNAWFRKHVNVLAWLCILIWHFLRWKSLAYWNQVGGDWKGVSCHGNRIFYSCRCVTCRTITLPNFNGLCCKLAQIALYILKTKIDLSVWCHQ